MVFCDFWTVFAWIGKHRALFFWIVCLFFMESSIGSKSNFGKRGRKKAGTSVFAFFASGWHMVFCLLRKKRRYRASFTVEAAFVLGVVMACICGLIGYAYNMHDTVTGKMILEEVMIQAQKIEDAEELSERSEIRRLEVYGEELGNPRLWLGAYNVEIDLKNKRVTGKAEAGDWFQEIEMARFRPGETLLSFEALKEIEKEWMSNGNGIQEGDEP